MKKVIVASNNPVKIQATQKAFEAMFPTEKFQIKSVTVPSFVSPQPMSDDETYEGAMNRAENAQVAYPDADFWVGIEGGIDDREDVMDAFAWMVVLNESEISETRSCTFPLPPAIANQVRAGKELGAVNDAFFKLHNSKQGDGAVGSLTDNKVTRLDLYVQPLMLALIPFLKEELWDDFEV